MTYTLNYHNFDDPLPQDLANNSEKVSLHTDLRKPPLADFH